MGNLNALLSDCHGSMACIYSSNCNGHFRCCARNTEKTSLARKVAQEKAGYEIGKYHVWTSIGGAVAVIATGYLVDFFTIGTIFILHLFYM